MTIEAISKAIGDESRRRIIEMLKDKTRSNAARTAEVNPVTVARIKRKFNEDVNGGLSAYSIEQTFNHQF
jgi:hypothetical protein